MARYTRPMSAAPPAPIEAETQAEELQHIYAGVTVPELGL